MSSVQWLLILLASAVWMNVCGSRAILDVGKAAYYSSPYTPTECYGVDPSQLPPSNLFAAAGGNLWDDGAACGRVYTVRCISASQSVPSNCANDRPIRIKIIDSALSSTSAAAAYKQSVTGAELVLSEVAFKAIAKPFAASIDIEFQEV
ncbi:EG45-like domain containing protein 2 [Eucalyptus grandis]|uniref:EG45-like domain containing protein 2 n=1 Tax=Eucalyptus grandis TaxID=71139 RepID=UPI00192F0415|nr:EG45-like domain containing protein 2 [Eucalyptus grandis]